MQAIRVSDGGVQDVGDGLDIEPAGPFNDGVFEPLSLLAHQSVRLMAIAFCEEACQCPPMALWLSTYERQCDSQANEYEAIRCFPHVVQLCRKREGWLVTDQARRT